MNTICEGKSVPQHFGQMVKKIRKKKQLTQEDLSEKSDIGVQYISRIETGTANPTLKIVSALAVALDATLSDLFSGLEADNN